MKMEKEYRNLIEADSVSIALKYRVFATQEHLLKIKIHFI
jgi:hypothetical protein